MDSDIKPEMCTALCSVCGKLYSNNIYRNRHMRVVHKLNAKGEEITSTNFTCSICKKNFGQKKYLQVHLNAVHLANQDTSTVYDCEVCNYKTPFKQKLEKHISKVHKNMNEEGSTKNFHCVHCKSKFTLLKHLKYHERKTHKIGETLRKQVKRNCPICPFSSGSRQREEINKHLENQHQINLDWKSLEFNSVEEFHSWKVEFEERSTAQYIKRDITDSRLHYICHRNGVFQSKSNGKRLLKTMGSCKIGGYCPSEIKVKILPNGSVEVMYLQTHVGHRNELKHIHLTSQERKLIATKLVNKTPHEEILKTIRGSVTNSDIKRIHLVNKKDIFNIKRNLNSDAVKHPCDTVNVQAWVNELNSSEDTALLVYKPKGEVVLEYSQLKEDDFFLIFMTETQKSFLLTHGHDTICIDGTHGENNYYNLQLYTLLILDESREGFPAAFMFSNRGDDTVLLLFFNKLKEVFGEMKPTIFISDLKESFYSTWSMVMGPVQLRLFSTWHILKAWQNNLSKIKCKKKKEEVYKILKTLIYELDIDTFNKQLDTAIATFLADDDIKDFGNYFREYYVGEDRYKQWAYCFRINAGINTNMSLENFNRLLDRCYLRGKQIKRVDKPLCAILNLLKDKLFDWFIKMKKGNLRNVRKLHTLRQRHKTSLLIPRCSVTIPNDGEWYILYSNLEEVSRVKKIKKCETCQLRCFDCNTCFHEYICTCIDNSLKNNMCEHIHVIGRVLCAMAESEHIWSYEEGDLQIELQSEETQKEEYCRRKSTFENEVQELLKFLQHKVTSTQQMDYVETQFKQIMTTVDAMESTG